jgi:hypothetical protein
VGQAGLSRERKVKKRSLSWHHMLVLQKKSSSGAGWIVDRWREAG